MIGKFLIQSEYVRPPSRAAREKDPNAQGARMWNLVELPGSADDGATVLRCPITVRADGHPQKMAGKFVEAALVNVTDGEWGVVFAVELLKIDGKPANKA